MSSEEVDVVIERGTAGFGFNIKGTTAEGGTMSAIAGELYPPLQYISAIDLNGVAYKCGLRRGDRILTVNGADVQGATHADVVRRVVQSGSRLELHVLRLDDAEIARLQRIEDAIEEKKPEGRPAGNMATISVDDYTDVPASFKGPAHTVFNISVDGRYRCCKRYSELERLHNALKQRFAWFKFPRFPGKKLNGVFKGTLDGTELERRRVGLDAYLSYVLAQEDIYKCDMVKQFLEPDERARQMQQEADRKAKAALEKASTGNAAPAATAKPQVPNPAPLQAAASPAPPVLPAAASPVPPPTASVVRPAPAPVENIAVTLPDGVVVTVSRGATVADTLARVVARTKLSPEAARLFALFLRIPAASAAFPDALPSDVDVPLAPLDRVPAVPRDAALVLRRWLFVKQQEAPFDSEAAALDFFYAQAVEDIARGIYQVGPIADKLEELKSSGDKLKFVRTMRKLKAYARVMAPPCACDFPEEGTVTQLIIDAGKITLHACDPASGEPLVDADGDAGEHATVLDWNTVVRWSVESNGAKLAVVYSTADGDEDTMNLSTPHAAALAAVMSRVRQERAWALALRDPSAGAGDPANFFQALAK